MNRAILLRYHEVALKGANRGWFEERLAINARRLIERALGKQPSLNVVRLHGRVLIENDWTTDSLAAASEALRRLFGLSSFSPMLPVETDLDSLAKAGVAELERYLTHHPMPRTFRVLTRRSDKALPQTSMEIDRIVGGTIHDRFPSLTVDLKTPDFTLGVELRFKRSYLWVDKVQGPGGLPAGTGGKVLTLLSGGIDSPVAALQMIRRGAVSGFIHFDGTPFVGPEALEKVLDLARIVNRWQPDPQPLAVVPFGKLQEKIATVTNPRLRTVLYRRMMIRIAAVLAERQGAQALVTGESLGQVASQTIENMDTVNRASPVMVLRPLVAMDKDEIIRLGQQWETYETSIRPAADCCTLFADRHPSIRSTTELVEEQESRFSVSELTELGLAGIEFRRAAPSSQAN